MRFEVRCDMRLHTSIWGLKWDVIWDFVQVYEVWSECDMRLRASIWGLKWGVIWDFVQVHEVWSEFDRRLCTSIWGLKWVVIWDLPSIYEFTRKRVLIFLWKKEFFLSFHHKSRVFCSFFNFPLCGNFLDRILFVGIKY